MFSPSISARMLLGLSSAGTCAAAGFALHTNSATQAATQSQKDSGQYDHLMGTWIRDKHASDSYENAMTVMQINPLLKTAMRQLKGIKLEVKDEEVVLTLLSRFSWFRLQERYPWSGQAVQIRRRDFRRGKAQGNLIQESDALWIEQQWDHPVAGHGSECAWSPEPGTLYIDSTIKVKDDVAQYRQVYREHA
ncbi:hypothetical protein ABBQ32_006860 [Trebouxia sp. C0010 RCD-2024]